MSQITVQPLTGDALRAAIPDLARLRCEVFAQWPYLYEGDPSYESDYLRDFAVAPGAVLIAAKDGERIVGIATASPMSGQKPDYQAKFTEQGSMSRHFITSARACCCPIIAGRGSAMPSLTTARSRPACMAQRRRPSAA
jgi:hypothetical protein